VRALPIGALAASLAGCSCFLPPQASIEGCTDANGLACLDRSAASQPLRPTQASFNTDPVATESKPTTPKRMTVGVSVPVPKPKANRQDRSDDAKPERGDVEKVAAVLGNEQSAGSAQQQPAHMAWIVSETTSPVDYAPLITAAVNATSSDKEAPNTLAVRCHRGRTELMLRGQEPWRAAQKGDLQVDFGIDDQPVVSQKWSGSPDGTSASYKGDGVGLLRSLPEGARLKISVLDPQGFGHEATFQLTGMDSVRKKIGSACNWPPPARG
jgi:hypothetical protein